MRHWTGVALVVAAAWLVRAALRQRNRVRAAAVRDTSAQAHALHPSLAMLGDILPPLILLALAVVAAQIVLAYAVLGAGRLFSLLDLGGFLALLAAYAFWMIVKTQYREVAGRRPSSPGA